MKNMKNGTIGWFAGLAAAALIAGSVAAFAQSPSAKQPRVVLKGYDAVAYFIEKRPVQGQPEFRHDFDGARYHFASQKNRDTFAADPDRYLPQFAGHCAGGLSMAKRVEADPTLWKIVDGKLYVFSSAKALEKAGEDPTILVKARANWNNLK